MHYFNCFCSNSNHSDYYRQLFAIKILMILKCHVWPRPIQIPHSFAETMKLQLLFSNHCCNGNLSYLTTQSSAAQDHDISPESVRQNILRLSIDENQTRRGFPGPGHSVDLMMDAAYVSRGRVGSLSINPGFRIMLGTNSITSCSSPYSTDGQPVGRVVVMG